MSDKAHDEMWDTLVAENVKLQAQVKELEKKLYGRERQLKVLDYDINHVYKTRIEELETPALPDDMAELIGELEGFGLDGSELTQRAADMLGRQQRDLAILNAEWERSTGVWQEEVAIKQQRIEELESATT